MANNSDGSITIDTELDNSGFEKGSDKLLGAVKDLTSAVDTLGDNMMRSFSQVIPLLSNISGSVSAVNDKMTETATQTADANDRVIESERQVSQVAQEAAQAVNQQGQSVGALASGAASAQTSISSLEREVNALVTGMQAISKSAETGFANGNAVLAFDSKLATMESKLADAKEKLEQFATTKIPTEDYQWLTAAIQKAEGEYDRLIERQLKMRNAGTPDSSKQWVSLNANIAEATRKIETYKSDLASLERMGQAFTLGSNTEDYTRMKASVDETAVALERNRALIDSEAIAQARLNVAAAQEGLIRAETSAEQAAAQENLRTAQQSLADVAASMSNKGNTAPSEEAISGWQRFGQVLKSAGSAAIKVVGTLAKAPFSALGKGIKTAVSGLKQFVSQSKKATLTSNGLIHALTSIKTLLKTRIKRMFISAIITGVKESIQSLAMFSSEFDKSMSDIKNSSKGLGANLAVSLGGLINAISPVLTKIINAISTAITYLNAFFALLSGKSTVTVAKKQTDSYAASLKKAGGEAEKLKRQVYGFDQLNKRSSDDKKDNGSGDGKDLYETKDIDSLLPDSVRDFFDRIKAAFEAGDWYGIGLIIAEGLNTAMGIVDTWINDTLRPMGVLWADRIAQLLNGLVDGFDWTLLGETIADGINAAFDTINTFLTTFNFENFGKGIGKAINGIFDYVEWDLIGQTFANKWNALINTIYGFVSTIDWSGIGLAASQLIENFFSTLDLSKATESIGIAINGVVAAVQTLLVNTDWMSIAASVGQAINTAFTTIDWGALGKMLITGFNTAVRMIGEFIRTVDWAAIGSDIATFLTESIQTIDWAALGSTLGAGLNALLDILITLVGETDWGAMIQSIVGGIGDAIGSMDLLTILAKLGGVLAELLLQIPGIVLGLVGGITDLLAGIFESIGLDSIAGFFKGLGDALADAGKWLKENLVDPVVDAIKELFGIHSPSTVFAEIGDDLIAGLLSGIKKTWGNITEFFSTAVSKVKQTLSTAWTNIKNTATQTWGSIKSSLSNTWSSIKSTASTTWDSIKTTASSAWSSIKTTASTKWADIKSMITTKWDSLKTTLSNTDWTSVGSSICNGIRDGIDTGWTWLKTTVSGLASKMLSTAKSALDINSPSRVFRDEVGKNISLGVAEGITDTESNVLKTVSNLAKDTANAFDTDAVSLNIEGNAMVTGLDAVADKLAGIAATFRSITDMLTSLGGLNTPQIAAGTVAPAKTRIDNAPGSDLSVAGFSTFTSDFDEYMAEQSGLLKQLIEVIKKLNLNIDVDSLSRAITSAQRARVRSYGG